MPKPPFCIEISLPDEQIPFGEGEAHCGAALDLMVSVDYVGKLSERLEANAPDGFDGRYRRNVSRHHTLSASFCPRHGSYQGQGAFRFAGRVSFVTFLCQPKKSKDDRGLPMIIVED